MSRCYELRRIIASAAHAVAGNDDNSPMITKRLLSLFFAH